MSLTKEQIQEVFEWVKTYPYHISRVIESAFDKDHPERVYHAILAFPHIIYEYDDEENVENSRNDSTCDYTFREGPLCSYQCPIQGSPVRGKMRCPFHSSLVFDLIDLADPITLPRTRPMIPEDFADLRERAKMENHKILDVTRVSDETPCHQFKQVSYADFLSDLNSRPNAHVSEEEGVIKDETKVPSGPEFPSVSEETKVPSGPESPNVSEETKVPSGPESPNVSEEMNVPSGPEFPSVSEEMNVRLGNGIQVIQVTEDEVFDTMNERMNAHRRRVTHVSPNEVFREFEARSSIPVIQVTEDEVLGEFGSRHVVTETQVFH